MITLIHGEDSLRARDKFTVLIEEYKKKGYEIIAEGSGNSLFSQKVLLVVENPKKFFWDIQVSDVLILYDGNVPANIIKLLPTGAKIEKFAVPGKLFAFLDKITLSSFQEIIKTEPLELVFAMLGRQFRDLYWANIDPKTLGYKSWRVAKLQGQAKKLGTGKLKKLLAKMSRIDVLAKTGERDLLTSLDLLIASELE